MMHNLEKSPGMFSDRPETTPKSLDLVVSSTCLREKEREPFGCGCGLVGVVRVTSIIRQVWPTPPFCPVADCPRYPGGPSAFEFLHCNPTDTASGKFCTASGGPSAVLWRTVRSVFLRLTTSLQSVWWKNLMNGGLSAPYPRTVRSTKFQSAQKFANFLNSNSNLGSLLI